MRVQRQRERKGTPRGGREPKRREESRLAIRESGCRAPATFSCVFGAECTEREGARACGMGRNGIGWPTSSPCEES